MVVFRDKNLPYFNTYIKLTVYASVIRSNSEQCMQGKSELCFMVKKWHYEIELKIGPGGLGINSTVPTFNFVVCHYRFAVHAPCV